MAIRQPTMPRAKPPTRPRWQSKYHGVRMTPEQYLALPEEKPYLEYVDGVVLQKPMPSLDRSWLLGELVYRIGNWMEANGGRAGISATAKLGDVPNYRIPDLSYWKPGIPRGLEAPPTLSVDVLVEDQTLAELQRKCEFLRASGVEACWLIDPSTRRAQVFEGRARKGRAVDVLRAECLPGFELPLAELFAVLDDEEAP